MKHELPISVVIPTFQRESVLVATIRSLLAFDPPAAEVLVVDQTPTHESETHEALMALESEGRIRWIRLSQPSIPRAMNEGLLAANSEVVLFLDDDIVPDSGLLTAHLAAYRSRMVTAVVGQVLQPGEEPTDAVVDRRGSGLQADLQFPFNSTSPAPVRNAMAGNLSVRRRFACDIGGFDENFVGVAYRFETEFARRVWRCEGQVLFEPSARIRHLRAERGGTRSHGPHHTSASPAHGVGDYYFALKEGAGWQRVAYMSSRLVREVCTRFHLSHPWWIPVKFIGEVRALIMALRLWSLKLKQGTDRSA